MKYKSREVLVGNVAVGGDNPVRIQSMTTSDTRDVQATADQIVRLADVGCDIARITVQGKKEADACEEIKNLLVQRGYTIPLVADIHFYPPAAMRVVDFADKVRINPGNFVDKRASFKVLEYTDETYAAEIERIEEKFSPLVEKCKRLKRAMRIGTNHGSLSDRIMNRYGDSPRGMVESALEYARICRKYDYHDFLFSMKSSNTQVMVEAYRLLVAQMMELGWDYPLHLGVTEAGEGEDGRVKSAIGIGSLLQDGIGDTVRVSLTEDPWCEIDPAKRIAALKKETFQLFCRPEKRNVITTPPLHRDGSVIAYVEKGENLPPKKADGIHEGAYTVSEEPLEWKKIAHDKPSYIHFAPSKDFVAHTRAFFRWLDRPIPVVLQFAYEGTEEEVTIQAAADFGALLIDNLGDGICLRAPNIPLEKRLSLSFAILQGARMRALKTEFISCPGCGRTLFNLQSVSEKIRQRTAHLPGVKVAIMGCIVNGPGEMADADFGYVGSRPGMIDLYVGKECVERNIPMEGAEEHLVELIKKHGRWVEPCQS